METFPMRDLKLKLFRTAFFSLACVFCADGAAAEFRVVTVDVNRVLNESKEAKEKRKELDQKSLEAKKRIDDKSSALRALEKKIKGGSATEGSKEAEQYRTQARDLDRMIKDSQEDLKKEFLKVNRSVTEKALKLIAEYAKANQIDLVLDKAEKTSGPVLYGDPAADITEEILKQMN